MRVLRRDIRGRGNDPQVRRRILILLSALLLVCAFAPATGHAAYESRPWSGCGNDYASGSFDTAGRTYVVCGAPSTVGIYAPDGALERTIDLPAHASDVEAVGDGHTLYVAYLSGPPRRYLRAPDGTYADDPTWRPEQYVMWGSTKFSPRGLFLDSDAAGNLYLADGYWASNTHTVVKYAPSGRVVTRFGEYQDTRDRGWFFHALGDIAVTPDGSRVLSIESGNNRLQVWKRRGSTYESVAEFGGNAVTNPDRQGYCDFTGWQGAFAAPYGIGVDRAGAVYVLNTTCGQVLRFRMTETGLDTYRFDLTDNLDVRVAGADVRPHGFVVAADGRVLVGQNARMLLPSGAAAFAAPPVRGARAQPEPEPPTAASSASTGPDMVPAPPEPDIVIESPAVAPAPTPMRAGIGLRRPYLARTRTGRALLLNVSCTARCTGRVVVRLDGRVVGTRRLVAWSGARRAVSIPLRARAQGSRVSAAFVAHAIGARTVTVTRSFRLRIALPSPRRGAVQSRNVTY